MIRRVLAAAAIAALAIGLGGCDPRSLFKKQDAEPNALTIWAAQNAESVGATGKLAQGPEGNIATLQKDGKTYELSQAGDKGPSQVRLFFVPVDKFDAALDKTLRAKIFPGGIATLGGNGEEQKKISEAELERFYIQLLAVKNSALCEGYTKPCDSISFVVLLGKLKGDAIVGGKARAIVLMPNMAVDSDKLIAGHVPDSKTLCGFDPATEAVPVHIVDGCDNLRRMTFAADNGFTFTAGAELRPLTPDALKMQLAALVAGGLYKDGALYTGSLSEAK